MARVRVLTAKLQQLKRAIIALINDFRPVWKEQAPIVRQEILDQFKSQAGGSWLPIKKSTMRWRKRRGYPVSNPPLQASGKLLRSLESASAPGAIELQQVKSMSIGSSLNQAAPNQFGANIKIRRKSEKQKKSGRGRKSKTILYRVTIPPRPFIPDGTKESFALKLSKQMESFMNRYIIRKLSEPPSKPTE